MAPQLKRENVKFYVRKQKCGIQKENVEFHLSTNRKCGIGKRVNAPSKWFHIPEKWIPHFQTENVDSIFDSHGNVDPHLEGKLGFVSVGGAIRCLRGGTAATSP